MKISRLTGAMTDISDDLLTSAMERSPKKRIVWTKAAALAACFVFAVTAGVIGLSNKQELPVQEAEPYYAMSADELKDTRFAAIFPAELPEGYVLDGEIRVYGDAVIKATYINGKDTLTVEIAEEDRFDGSDGNGGVYVKCDGLGALYSGEGASALLKTALSADCFAGREIVKEIPHSYDEPVSGECPHKYYNLPHSGEPILHQVQHMDNAGYVCTITFEEYWHDMVCCACGEPFGGYYKICSEMHSNYLPDPIAKPYKDTYTTFFGTCANCYKGFCYYDLTYDTSKQFTSRIEEYLTYGYPLRYKESVEELKYLIDQGFYEVDGNGIVVQNGYYVMYELGYDIFNKNVVHSVPRFYDTDENVLIHIYRTLNDDGTYNYELRKDTVTPDMQSRITYAWG